MSTSTVTGTASSPTTAPDSIFASISLTIVNLAQKNNAIVETTIGHMVYCTGTLRARILAPILHRRGKSRQQNAEGGSASSPSYHRGMIECSDIERSSETNPELTG